MSTEEKFRAAVNVIRHLPKNGPVQTSNHVMLKFYGYYKQATEGPNTSPKPPFWDIVKKAKWDAWNKLGGMERETAMKNYVQEFKKIVETVSNSKPGSIDKSDVDTFYASVPVDDLQLVVGTEIQNARSRSSSPTRISESEKSYTSGTTDIFTKNANESVTVLNGISQTNHNSANDYVCGRKLSVRNEDEEEEDEYFLDTIENSDQGSSRNRISSENEFPKMNAQLPYYVNNYNTCTKDDSNNNNRKFYSDDREINIHITQIITCLQKDLEKVVKSVNCIEQRIGQLQGRIVAKKSNQFPILTSPIISFVVLFSWPILLQLLILWFRRKR